MFYIIYRDIYINLPIHLFIFIRTNSIFCGIKYNTRPIGMYLFHKIDHFWVNSPKWSTFEPCDNSSFSYGNAYRYVYNSIGMYLPYTNDQLEQWIKFFFFTWLSVNYYYSSITKYEYEQVRMCVANVTTRTIKTILNFTYIIWNNELPMDNFIS